VLIQGLTAGTVARWLGITGTKATGAVIVGCSPLSLLIARLIQEKGDPVVIIDTNEECLRSRQHKKGIQVFINSALDKSTLEKAGLAKAGYVSGDDQKW
jgi:Trk K+ transport system NAD-binding subunit